LIILKSKNIESISKYLTTTWISVPTKDGGYLPSLSSDDSDNLKLRLLRLLKFKDLSNKELVSILCDIFRGKGIRLFIQKC
jgi:hypothetical protein